MKDRRTLRIKQVSEVTGVPASTIYEWLREDRHADINFPRPVRLAARTVAWYSDEIQDWINSRPRV